MSFGKKILHWIGYSCDYCGLECREPSRVSQFRVYLSDEEITVACSFGLGCAKRPADHERKRTFAGSKREIAEYKIGASWMTIAEICSKFLLKKSIVESRLSAGWAAEHVVLSAEDIKKINDDTKDFLLKTAQGAQSSAASKSATFSNNLDRLCVVMSMSRLQVRSAMNWASAKFDVDDVQARQIAIDYRRAKQVAANKKLSEYREAMSWKPSKVGRPTKSALPTHVMAAEVGMTRTGLHKAAKRHGISFEQEYRLRKMSMQPDNKMSCGDMPARAVVDPSHRTSEQLAMFINMSLSGLKKAAKRRGVTVLEEYKLRLQERREARTRATKFAPVTSVDESSTSC